MLEKKSFRAEVQCPNKGVTEGEITEGEGVLKEILQENNSELKYCFQLEQTILTPSKINEKKKKKLSSEHKIKKFQNTGELDRGVGEGMRKLIQKRSVEKKEATYNRCL